jgi:hypothetical protein
MILAATATLGIATIEGKEMKTDSTITHIHN